jgi:hypothetical protein
VTDFRWDEQTNEYLCPRGEPSRSEWRQFKTPRSHVAQADTITYRSSQLTCASWPLKLRCCPNTPMRKIACGLHEQSRAVARRIADTAAYRQSRKDRRKVEVRFAQLKRILKLDRLRLRGRRAARDDFLLAATAHNLRRMAKSAMRIPVIEPIRAT